MRWIKVVILSLLLGLTSAIAFAPGFSLADITQVFISQLGNPVAWKLNTAGNFVGQIATDNVLLTAADTDRFLMYGGSALSNANGASIELDGNSFSGNNGNIFIATSTASGANVDIGTKGATGSIFLDTTNIGTHRFAVTSGGDLTSDATNGGNVIISVAGKGFQTKGGGAAAKAGQFTCNGVTGVVISTSAAATSMAIAFGASSFAGTAPIGSPYVSAITAGTSFTVKCSVAAETTVYNWAMINVN